MNPNFHPNFQGLSTPLNGLQNQFTGYSINLAAGRITLLYPPFHLISIQIILPSKMLDLGLHLEQSQITAATEPATYIQQDITLSAKQSVCHNPTEVILQSLTLSNEIGLPPMRWYRQPTDNCSICLRRKTVCFFHVCPYKPVIPRL